MKPGLPKRTNRHGEEILAKASHAFAVVEHYASSEAITGRNLQLS